MCLTLEYEYDSTGHPKYNQDRIHYLFLKVRNRSSFMKRLNASKEGEITCWKVYEISDNKKMLESYWQRQRIRKPGVVKSNRTNKYLTLEEENEGFINKGIHVYTTRKKAKQELKDIYNEGVIVPVICRKSDLVAQGISDDAVFTKVRIRSRTWNKIFAEKKNA